MRGGETFTWKMSEGEKGDGKPEQRKFQSTFYFTVGVLLLLIPAISMVVGAEDVFTTCTAFAFVFSLQGWLKARSIPLRLIGVVLTGISGGILLLWVRAWVAFIF